MPGLQEKAKVNRKIIRRNGNGDGINGRSAAYRRHRY
jgi:hypothetical protein